MLGLSNFGTPSVILADVMPLLAKKLIGGCQLH